MKVSDVIEELKRLPQGALVVMAKDAEGNGYSPLSEVWGNSDRIRYDSDGWEGSIIDLDDPDGEYWSKEDLKGMDVAVVLWPTN